MQELATEKLQFRLDISICGNAETMDQNEEENRESCDAAIRAAQKLGEDAEVVHSFRAWNGGVCTKAAFMYRGIAADLYVRTAKRSDETEYSNEGGDWEFGPWEMYSRKLSNGPYIPKSVIEKANMIVAKVAFAM